MMNEKVGTIAGQIWNALNENGALNNKDLKKAAKVKTDKELFLGLGWLLREDKVTVTEAEKDIVVALN
ncbi:MAG: winged helix-turn-helix domain-containing protein [Bacteroidaceae bacterium]|nr:winged helix-turn-helix domain-containing protein [Bacteroidaceae bacterium]MBQ6189746.1 winged helix-turn-helix domain-containing protein [Bacteroidaceae bacterium]MBQ8051454.1 winged helix-turn-helix domain-containing protein [Bacteroidaceae bacterium]